MLTSEAIIRLGAFAGVFGLMALRELAAPRRRLRVGKRRWPATSRSRSFVFNHGETDMGDKGSKDKGKREQQKKAQLSLKEKRKLKKEKKNK